MFANVDSWRGLVLVWFLSCLQAYATIARAIESDLFTVTAVLAPSKHHFFDSIVRGPTLLLVVALLLHHKWAKFTNVCHHIYLSPTNKLLRRGRFVLTPSLVHHPSLGTRASAVTTATSMTVHNPVPKVSVDLLRISFYDTALLNCFSDPSVCAPNSLNLSC